MPVLKVLAQTDTPTTCSLQASLDFSPVRDKDHKT